MEEIKQINKTTGDFQTKVKFIEFIGGKGNVNFLSNSATIQASQLSGIYFDEITFKLTIFEDGTVDFEELNTNKTTFDERKRLLEILSEKTLGSFRGRTVINELTFTSIEKVKDKNIPLFLSVQHTKPIDKLGSLLNDEVEISDDAMDNLNDLLNSWFEDEDFTKMIEETVVEEINQDIENVEGIIGDTIMQHDDIGASQIQNLFSKMKEEKLQELSLKKKKTEEEIRKHSFQMESSKKLLQDAESELKLLEDRIQDLKPPMENNGYYFSVSERQNEQITLDKGTEDLIRKTVSKVKSINLDNFMKLFTDGEFHIMLGKKIDDRIESILETEEYENEVFEQLQELDLMFKENKFIYQGELSWAEIVNKLIKMGFQNDPNFDEMCFPKVEEVDSKNISKF